LTATWFFRRRVSCRFPADLGAAVVNNAACRAQALSFSLT
jgi:hypothetical protein